MRRGLWTLLMILVASLPAPPVIAASETGLITRTSRPVRLLRSWEETVKLPDGREVPRRVDVVFDYRKGVAREDYYDGAGRFTGSRRITQILPSPSPEEVAEALSIVRGDGQMQGIISRSSADLTGGFVVEEGRGRPCGPGSRCLLVMVISHDHSSLIQRVVVDLVKRDIPYRNFDPTEHGGVK